MSSSSRFTTATAFLEHASTSDVLTYTVPTRGPIDQVAPPPILNQSDHALYSSTYYPPYSSSPGFVLARIIEDAFTLELRWVSFTRNIDDEEEDEEEEENPFKELDRHPGTLAPVRFTFPSRLVPNPSFNIILPSEEEEAQEGEEGKALQICTVTEAGYLYALSFPLDSLFYRVGDNDRGQHWSEEFRVEALEGRTPVLVQGAQEGRLVIACSDGHTVVAEIAEGSDGALIETELKTPSSFSIRSLVPSFSRRDLSSTSSSSSSTSTQLSSPLRLVPGSSSHSTSHPSQLVSLATSNPTSPRLVDSMTVTPTFGFGVSRDRKLKVWNLESGTCLRSIDLPKPSSSSSSGALVSSSSSSTSPHESPQQFHQQRQQQQQGSQLLLPPTPQTFLKITTTTLTGGGGGRGGTFTSYLTLYTPPSSSPTSSSSSSSTSTKTTTTRFGTFFVYGLATDPSTGELSQLAPVAERSLVSSSSSSSFEGGGGGGARLVDFEVEKMGLNGQEKWCLWTLEEKGRGETELKVCRLSELDDDDDEEEDEQDDDDDEWKFVSRGGGGGGRFSTNTAEWTAAYFDHEIKSASSSSSSTAITAASRDVTTPWSVVSEIFFKHVSTPGRYPPASFDYALDHYEEMISNELAIEGRRRVPIAFEREYESTLSRTVAVVASHIEMEYSGQTGAPLTEEYTKRVKLEWLRFVALLNESRTAALFPTLLSVDETRGIAFVVGRDSISVPVRQEAVQSIHEYLLPEGGGGGSSSTTRSNLLAPLFPSYPESNFPSLVALVNSVVSNLSLSESRAFEATLLNRLRIPFTTDIEDIALDLFEQTLERALGRETLSRILEGLKSFVEPSKTIESFCQLLVSTRPPRSTRSIGHRQGTSESTDLSDSLLTDLVTTSVQARYDLAKGLVLVLVAAWGASDEEGAEPPMASFEQTTSLALSTLHSIATLEWTTTRIVYPSLERIESTRLELEHERRDKEDGFSERFRALNMAGGGGGGGAEVLPVATYSLVNSLLRIPTYSPTLTSPKYAALAASLSDACSDFLGSTGVLAETKPLIDTTSNDVRFAYSLARLGLNEQVKELIAGYPKDAGLAYVEARAELELGDGLAATKNFERAASGFFAIGTAAPSGSVRCDGLESILSANVKNLSSYYIHLVSLFVPTAFDASIARFAQLALDALDQEAEDGEDKVDDTQAKDLWTKLFRSWAALGDYEKAYQAIMDAPYHETKTTCLAHFISLVCENGAASLLTTLSFVGLEGDLERNLAFRARNSDPLAVPDYYKVLYAFHVSKGDYRSAGTVMYQQARRIGDITARGGSFRDLATVQCQSYLAAANALSLVAREHAWVAIIADDNLERGNKRRKINYHIPDDEYDPTASRPLELRQLADIRREYTVALARLQLSVEFPEVERTNFHLEPEAVVALFSQTNAFEQAFNAGRALDVDLSSLFEILAEKCVGLTIHPEGTEDASWVSLSPEVSTWDGSLASKAWRLLERHLTRHDSAPVYRYRLVVLERVLATNRDGKIPTFLIDFLLRHQPSALVKILIRFDRLEEAFRYSLETIQNSTKIQASNFSTTLPYTLFDQLLAIPPGDSPHISNDVLKQRQQDLNEALDARKNLVEKLDSNLRR